MTLPVSIACEAVAWSLRANSTYLLWDCLKEKNYLRLSALCRYIQLLFAGHIIVQKSLQRL